MDKKEQQEYLETYKRAKEEGIPFFPDALFKDAVVSLLVFLILIGLAYFVGAPLEERADPADTTYTPRPEWYFMFLFQLLKYFPGELEVIGVVVVPTLAIILLFLLPFLDRNRLRHFINRPVIMGITGLLMGGVVALTILAIREAPPPAEVAIGDPTAALYTQNCSGCHGPSITVPTGTNLHSVIEQGKHEGMPAWSADLTTDQIDALAGFVLSPGGSQLFVENCGACHGAPELVAGDPLEIKNALETGPNFASHADQDVPEWSETIGRTGITALLNFLVAPDGQRLFAINCSPCHGRSVAFSGDETELGTIIAGGGLHLEMPPWREKLLVSELDTLTNYVVDPNSAPDGETLFASYCSSCHGERIPMMSDAEEAQQVIARGGAHETMPVWGDVLTPEQLDALAMYTFDTIKGTSLEEGQVLYAQNCTSCHGDLGEGGINPARAEDIIAPISTSEYLKTRDDFTLRAIVSQGQPNFGMSPFGSAFGGPLDDDEVDAVVAYLRSWEANPPVEIPPEVAVGIAAETGEDIYDEVCTQCHGDAGEGGIGPQLRASDFQSGNTDRDIFNTINRGHDATNMIAWGEILSSQQIEQLVAFIREFQPGSTQLEEEAEPSEAQEPGREGGAISFAEDVMPIFVDYCTVCHGTLGGWDATSYDAAVNSGDNAPVVVPGDIATSLLAQKILGIHSQGQIMPTDELMPIEDIQIILRWIAEGAEDN